MEFADYATFMVYGFFLCFVRISACIMVYPTLSDRSVNMRTRLLLALVLSITIYPLVSEGMPIPPENSGILILDVLKELAVGVLMALAARFVMAAVSVAGELMGFMTGFQAASMFDPITGANSSALGVFLSLIAGVLLFAFEIHHILIAGLAESFSVIPVTEGLSLSDSLTAVTKAMSHMMQIGVKLAAPVMVIGFLGYVVFGIFNRMIPQLHVFFISLPVSIGVGLIILGISLAGVVTLIGQELEKNAILFGA